VLKVRVNKEYSAKEKIYHSSKSLQKACSVAYFALKTREY
jgi:hypothetical protein